MQAINSAAICELNDDEIDLIDGGSVYTGYVAVGGAALAYGAAIAGGPIGLVALGVGVAIGALAS